MIKKKIVRKKKGGISEEGFSDTSRFRDREFIDIDTPNGTIDMSQTGIPLYAEDETGYGQYLPPYSGMHQFRGKRVRERRLPMAQFGLPPLDKPNRRDNTRLNRELLTPKEQADLAMRNQIAQNATVMTQAKVQTAAQKATEKAKKQAYTVTHPNAQLDANGNLTTKNPYRTLEGTPVKGTRAWYNAQALNTALDAGLVAADLQGTGALVRAGVKGVAKEGAEQISSKVLSRSSGMDAIYAKQPGYNSHLFKKQGYVPPTTDPSLIGTLNAPKAIAPRAAGDEILGSLLDVNSMVNESLGVLRPGKQKAINKGNDWINNWIQHPTTQNKIKSRYGEEIALRERWAASEPEQVYKDALGNSAARMTERMNTTLTKPVNVQQAPMIEHLKNFIKGKKQIHRDNSGVSFNHYPEYSYDYDKSFVSRNPVISNKNRESTTIHEGTHEWANNTVLDDTGQKSQIVGELENWADQHRRAKWDNLWGGTKKAYDKKIGYLAEPTEVHARIMELRRHYNMTPDDVVTPERAGQIMNDVRNGKTKIDKKFADIFRGRDGVANLFNKLFTAAPVAAAGTAAALSDKKRLGGNIYQEGGESDDLLELFDDDYLLGPATAPAAEEVEEKKKPQSTMEADLRRQREYDAAMEIVNEERLPPNERRGMRTSAINYGAAPSPSTGGAKGTKNANGEYAYNYLINEKGLPAHWAAGIVGNYIQESGNFREDVINGTVTGDGGKAKGSAQWHPDRWAKLVEYNKKLGQNPFTLKAQLDFTVHEATQRGDFEKMKAAKNSAEAAYIFAKWYERPKIIDNNRARYAQLYHP